MTRRLAGGKQATFQQPAWGPARHAGRQPAAVQRQQRAGTAAGVVAAAWSGGGAPTGHCARLTARVPARLRAAPLALSVHMRCLNAALPAGLGGPLPLVGCPAGPGIGGAVKELWKSKKE